MSSWKDLFVRPSDEPSKQDGGDIDIDALLESTRSMTGAAGTPASPSPGTPAAPAAEPASTAGSAATLEENRPFADIYAEQYVPPAPKSVDDILAVLQGIKNMPPPAQLQVITAMDEADAGWDITDVLADAQAKIDALRLAKKGLDDRLQASLSIAETKISSADTQITAARTKIGATIAEIESQIKELQGQISEFQSLLQQEETLQETAKATAQAEQASAREVAQREAARYDAEIARLTNFITTFSN